MTELPRNLPAERALLSACILDRNQYERLRARITPAVFTTDQHRVILEAMQALDRSGLDFALVTILAEIDREDARGERFRAAGGVELLGELGIAGIPSKAGPSYLKILEECAHKRGILKAVEELAGMAKNGADVEDLARVFQSYTQRMERILTEAEGIRTVDVLAALSDALPPVPWIADGWLGEGDVVIFAGEWASGKSLIALDLALSVALGMPWMGRVPITKPGPVLYCDEENNARNVSRRLSRMFRGRNLDPELASTIPLRYLSKNHLRLDTPAGRTALEREIEANHPIVTILDSLIRFHGQDENSNTDVAALFGEAIVPLATKHGCAFVVLDHMRKPGKDDERFDQGHRIRGAGDKAGVGDGVWTLEGDRATDSRTLSCRKNRWEDSLPPAMTTTWKVSEDEAAAWIECRDAALTAEAVLTSALLASGAEGEYSGDLRDAAEKRGIPIRAAIRTLNRLVARGVAEKVPDGRRMKYRLSGT